MWECIPTTLVISMRIKDLESEELTSIQALALRVQLAAAGIASSLLLILIPNIETITFTVFLVGFLFSIRYALSITLTTVIGWEILVSMIFAFSGITFFFKLGAWLMITLLGSLARRLYLQKSYEFAIFGAISALLFDFAVTIPYALFFSNTQDGFLSVFLASLIFGIYFTILHTLGNTILFSFIPRMLDTLFPLLEGRYGTVVKIDKSFFIPRSRNIVTFVFISIIIISPLMVGIYNYNNVNNSGSSENELINITLNFNYADVIPFETYELYVNSSMSVFDIMRQVVVVNYNKEWINLPYIEAINNVWENLNISNHKWIYYINSNYAQSAVSLAYLSDADIVLWNYE